MTEPSPCVPGFMYRGNAKDGSVTQLVPQAGDQITTKSIWHVRGNKMPLPLLLRPFGGHEAGLACQVGRRQSIRVLFWTMHIALQNSELRVQEANSRHSAEGNSDVDLSPSCLYFFFKPHLLQPGRFTVSAYKYSVYIVYSARLIQIAHLGGYVPVLLQSWKDINKIYTAG